MNGEAGKTTTKKPSHSWMTMGLYYPSSGKSGGQAKAAMSTEGKNGGNNEKSNSGGDKKKRSMSLSITRSVACAGSICSTKESSVMNRDRGASASSRSLRAPNDVVSAAAVSATSSFNSEATATTTVTVSSSSPFSSALSSPLSSLGGSSFRGVQIRKLSGCYSCQSVFDPRSLGTSTFPCADCDEVFVKAESLELHRATRHAVSELGPEDTSRNIVQIIFQSSWLRKQAPVCRIERILKVQSGDGTVKRFEQYKESIKERASNDQGKKNARCVADGNELLRFYATTFTCALGASGGTALCGAPWTQCKLCGIIKDGFRVDEEGKIAVMATSGRAHDMADALSDGEKKAMLVCRVVAGRVKRATDDTELSEESDCDSVSPCSSDGVYSDLDELLVFNPRAILPCFVVIYSGY